MLAGMRRDRRGQQDRVMTESVAAPRLAQHEPAAEHGILAVVLIHLAAVSGLFSRHMGRHISRYGGEARRRDRPLATACAPPPLDRRRPGYGAGKCRSSLPARSYSDRPPYARYARR